MAELLKNIYDRQFFTTFIDPLYENISDFDSSRFLANIFDPSWEHKELKQRMRHITLCLKNHLPPDFEESVEIILKVITSLRQGGIEENMIEYMFFPDFIEVYGLDNYEVSVRAMETVTQFTSCEFAVRPFILRYTEAMISQMHQWSGHEHPMVRRLATEGCRPRLPWAMALPFLKKDPSSILPILEKLKNDPSESVRRSVANNLNDISKDNPEIVIALIKAWKGQTKETDWLIKHASRTLLKAGTFEVMQLFGFGNIEAIGIHEFKITTQKVSIGQFLEFQLELQNSGDSAAKLRLEYGIYYQKANSSLSKKVFKISEKEYPPNSITKIERRQSFKEITTRKYHPGLHRLSIIINGIELNKLDFELIKSG